MYVSYSTAPLCTDFDRPCIQISFGIVPLYYLHYTGTHLQGSPRQNLHVPGLWRARREALAALCQGPPDYLESLPSIVSRTGHKRNPLCLITFRTRWPTSNAGNTVHIDDLVSHRCSLALRRYIADRAFTEQELRLEPERGHQDTCLQECAHGRR